MISYRPCLTARLHARVRRVVLSVILGGLIAAPAHAGPLLFTFSGVIPTFAGLTQVNTVSNGQSSTEFSQTLLFNVPFSGSMTFDSDVWALAGAPSPNSFLRQFTVADPPNAGSTTGVDTPELIRGTIDVGDGVGTLRFDRQMLDELPATGTPFPYQGNTTMGYIDGSEGLNLNPPFEFGDYFFFNYANAFSWTDFTTTAPGGVYGRSDISSVSLALLSDFNFMFQLQNLFPAGPPVAFSFVDPDPNDCTGSCLDGRGSSGSFFVQSSIGAYTADGSQLTTTTYQGNVVVHQATLGPAAVPEPSSLALFALGAAAAGVARQRSRREDR